MAATTIPMIDAAPYHLYRGAGRNFNLAVWYGGRFYGLRRKWSQVYVDGERHVDDPDGGTFSPHEDLGSLKERLSPACFDAQEWRTREVLHDILFCAEMLMLNFGDRLDQEAQGHEEQH